jgi:hypothetical protein
MYLNRTPKVIFITSSYSRTRADSFLTIILKRELLYIEVAIGQISHFHFLSASA